ncbi:hypothetical protein [Vibrio fortis]|uniref:hypothetical protein n=1 Tax=Vibrio fortis TaxID=212667 RepID=UPI003EBB9B27
MNSNTHNGLNDEVTTKVFPVGMEVRTKTKRVGVIASFFIGNPTLNVYTNLDGEANNVSLARLFNV